MEPLAPEDPRQVGAYRLHARLGAGGMGRVYLGYSPGGRAVAVKVVHPDLARDPEFMARFQREAQAVSAVGGVYTAPVVSAGPADNPPWLATAYVAGPSLADLVSRTGPMPDAAVWRLAGGLVEALQAIHAQGLVHRDLKPGNILLAPDGPRVIDFGISRALMSSHMTSTQTTMGTPAFMSPEQAQGLDVGPASDVFSLGSVLAYAATGTAPFDGGPAYSVVFKVVSTNPDLSRLSEGPYGPAGPGLRALVAACLAKDPAQRPTLEQLITAVGTASGAFPPPRPGKFWPDQVDSAIESRTVDAPPGPVTPAPGPGTLGPATPGHVPSGPVTPGLARPGPVTPVPSVPPGYVTTPPARRRGVNWLAVTAGAVVAAIALGVVLALLLSPKSGPPSPSASSGGGPSATGKPASAAASGSPAGSPSASGTLIAVTVCSQPAGGCTYAGASQIMEVKPKQILVSGDGSGYVDGLTWSNWGSTRATATGTLKVNNCNPSCAQGAYANYPAAVTVAGLKPYGTGLEAYSTIVVQSPAANLTYTYTKDTVP